MGYDTGLADRCRRRGLTVVEVDGWRTRGSSTFDPAGSVNHHTAGAPEGNAPSLGVCINGRANLPGPLCNTFMARDNTVYVVAAGRANHAGAGGFAGLSGNSSVYGLEIENVGTSAEPWRQDQRDTAALVHAAMLEAVPSAVRRLPCQHYEWTTRKIDAHDWSGVALRQTVAALLATPEPGDDVVLMHFARSEHDPRLMLMPGNFDRTGREVLNEQHRDDLVYLNAMAPDGEKFLVSDTVEIYSDEFMETYRRSLIVDPSG